LRILRRAADLLAANPEPSAADFRLRGVVEAGLGNHADGAAWFERALMRDASHAEWFYEAAAVNAMNGDGQRALRYARRAWILNPNDRYRHMLEQLEAAVATDRTIDSTRPSKSGEERPN
jgi:tetratricopeptide (TPR) repeat protein